MQEKEDWGCCYKDCNIQILAAAAPWGRKKNPIQLSLIVGKEAKAELGFRVF